jgi:hypothetical protein
MNHSTLQKEEPMQSEEVCSVTSFSMGMEQSWPEELCIRRELLLRIGIIRRSFTWPSTRISTVTSHIFAQSQSLLLDRTLVSPITR